MRKAASYPRFGVLETRLAMEESSVSEGSTENHQLHFLSSIEASQSDVGISEAKSGP